MKPGFISLASEVRSATMELLLITRDKIGHKVVVSDAQTQIDGVEFFLACFLLMKNCRRNYRRNAHQRN